MPRPDPIRAHDFCTNNRPALARSTKCGCFYCLNIFDPRQITQWLAEGSGTALCPYCTTDAVIPESPCMPITEAFLKEMRRHWF